MTSRHAGLLECALETRCKQFQVDAIALGQRNLHGGA
jgi:hypothetical protein